MQPFLHLLRIAALLAIALLPRAAQAQVDAYAVPSGLWSAANAHLRSYLGDSLFEASVRPRPDLFLYEPNSSGTCRLGGINNICPWPGTGPYVVMYYDFDPMSDPSRTGLIAITIEPSGTVIREFPPAGAPSCRFYPERCRFTITADSAVALARQATAAAPSSRWEAQFVWLDSPRVSMCYSCSRHFAWPNVGIETYGWEVMEAGGNDWRALLVIDATSGAVLRQYRISTHAD